MAKHFKVDEETKGSCSCQTGSCCYTAESEEYYKTVDQLGPLAKLSQLVDENFLGYNPSNCKVRAAEPWLHDFLYAILFLEPQDRSTTAEVVRTLEQRLNDDLSRRK